MILKRFMRVFFYLLYHPFARLYDLVAGTVSLGQWKDWVMTVLPLIEGNRVLELGHGPGHLQRRLLKRGGFTVGLDRSAQMGRLAQGQLGRAGNLVRGHAQSLPFADGSFQTVVATFPTEYIFEARSLAEIYRCLSGEGCLILLPVAWPASRWLKWLYRVTGQSPPLQDASLGSRLSQPFIQAWFATEVRLLEVKSGVLMLVTAKK